MKTLKCVLIAALLIMSASGVMAQDTTYNWVMSVDETGVIPDNTIPPDPPIPGVQGDTAFLTIAVAGLPNRIGTLAFINTALDITHTAVGDLRITLVSPKGTQLKLIFDVGSNDQEDLTGTVFTQTATDNIAAGDEPYTGNFLPQETPPGLAAFDGENPNGVWTLQVYDKGYGDQGLVNSWSMKFSKLIPNTAPIAVNDRDTTNQDAQVGIDVTINDTDSDGSINKTTVTIQDSTNNGKLAVNAVSGVITYTPTTGFFGKDTLSYKVKDDDSDFSNIAFVYILVNKTIPNVAPVAKNDSAETTKNTAVTIAVTANDVDEDGINKNSIVITSPPLSGVAELINGEIRYTPNTNFIGNDTIRYQVKDNLDLISNAATVKIKVKSDVNLPPIARNDNFTHIPVQLLIPDSAYVIIYPLVNDEDDQGLLDTSSLTIVRQPAYGTAKINFSNGSIDYRLGGEDFVYDTITYNIKDKQGLVSNTATIFIFYDFGSGIAQVLSTYKLLNTYPNPTTGEFKIQVPENIQQQSKISITVFDVSGKKVYERLENYSKELSINLNSLEAGSYTFKLATGQEYYSGRVNIVK